MNEATALSLSLSAKIERDLEKEFDRWSAERRGKIPPSPPTPPTLPLAPKNNIQEGKPRASLAPMDIIIKYDTAAYEEGLIKYRREPWRQGFQVSVMVDAALRHISDFFYKGEDYDPAAEALGVHKHHLAAARFCLASILHTLDTRPDLDDRPHRLLGPNRPTWPEPDPDIPITHYTPEDD